MTYSAEINRAHPGCLLLLIDQSWSMSGDWTAPGSTKAEALAYAVNRLISNAILLCTKGSGKVHDYFDVGVIGYGAEVGPVLAGSSKARPLLPISVVADSPIRIDSIPKRVSDGAGGLVEIQTQMPIWLEPTALNGTPMVRAMMIASDLLDRWCSDHPGSFPPIVLNVTDGESGDGDPRIGAEEVRRTGVADGSTLLFNLHIAGGRVSPIELPSDPTGLPGPTAVALFEASSVLPENLATAARSQGFHVRDGSRGFMYNARAESIIEFLNLGTRAVTPTGLRELESGSGLV